MNDGKTLRLSIITPVYNAMPYLGEYLDSVLTQDVDFSLFELILVDDASTDGSGDLCREMAQDLPNVRSIFLENNSGGGSRPRNVGIEAARGEFLFFADADDTFYPGALRKMLEYADELGFDMGLFKVDGREWGGNYAGLFTGMQTHCSIDESRILDFFGVYRMIKRSVLIENDIRFIDGILPEDWAFTLECYLCAMNVCVVSDQYYYRYRKRDDGKSLSFGSLTEFAGSHEAKVRAFHEYLAVAKRYVNLDDHPRIGLRVCRVLAKTYELSDEKNMTDGQLDDYRNLASIAISDSVRAIAPFTTLTKIDALMARMPASEYAKTFAGMPSFAFGQVSQSGFVPYDLLDENSQVLLSGLIPTDCREELADPRLSLCGVKSTGLDGAIITISGSSYLLRAAKPSRDPFARIGLYNTDYMYDIDMRVENFSVSCAYGPVNAIAFDWTVFIDIERAPFRKDGKAVQLDPSVIVELDNGQTVSMRIGSRCDAQVLDLYRSTTIESTRLELKPGVTGYGNFRLSVRKQ